MKDLYRAFDYEDLHWSHVGPAHERASFNCVDLVGYAPSKADVPPFHIYNVYGWLGTRLRENSYDTVPAAKRAGRAWVKNWLLGCDGKPVEWQVLDTGVHWAAHVHGLKVASYYYCPEPKGHWHQGFRVYFGGTYYVVDFASPEDAREVVMQTWLRWLACAQERLLNTRAEVAA